MGLLRKQGRPLYTVEANAAYLLKPSTASTPAVETTSSTTYVDLATVGPNLTMTVPASGSVLVTLSAEMFNGTATQYCAMGVNLSGANTVAPIVGKTLIFTSPTANAILEASYTMVLTGLTPGSTTFTARYAVSGGTGTFANRHMIVQPL